MRAPGLHAGDDAGAVRGGRRPPSAASTRPRDRSTRCSSCRRATNAKGQGDAPWPPQYKKQPGEPARVQPSRRRVPKHPLVEIGRAEKKEDALAGLERWRARHPEAAAHSQPADVLVDAMRGRFHTWTRIRVNLQHVPEAMRPRAGSARSGRRTRYRRRVGSGGEAAREAVARALSRACTIGRATSERRARARKPE